MAWVQLVKRHSRSQLLESLKGKTCCRQVKFYSGAYALALAMVLPFKDSEGGTWFLFDFNWSYLCRHAPVKKQTQYANRAKDLPLIKTSVPPLARPLNPAAPRTGLCYNRPVNQIDNVAHVLFVGQTGEAFLG